MFGRNKKKTESITQLPQTSSITPKQEDFEPEPVKKEQVWDDDVEESVEDDAFADEFEAPKPVPAPVRRPTLPQTQRRVPEPVQEDKLEKEIIAWIHTTDKRLDQIERVIDSFADDVNTRLTSLESKMFRIRGAL